MKNIKLLIEYDGTNYGGWQRQENSVTIQQKIEESIYQITNEKVKVIGCSRTDAGVHARGFVCNFTTGSSIEAFKFKGALNSKLPDDIRVLDSSIVLNDFHARYNSKGKTYSYTILNREVCPAIYRNYLCHVKQSLDVNSMRRASQYLVGTHDFSAFKNTGSSVKTSVRTMKNLEILADGQLIKIYATADGFLYNMMRIIVGTLIEIGCGKKEIEDMHRILLSCDRKKAGKSAPPQGLCLEEVFY